MTTPLWCLVLFALWAIVLVLSIGAVRVLQVMTRKVPPNGFPSGTPHGGDRYWRLNRAHLNTLENLPIFAALVVAGTFANVTTPLFSQLAVAVVCARVAQSTFHVASGSNTVVNLRFTAFCVQLGCFAGMAWQLLPH